MAMKRAPSSEAATSARKTAFWIIARRPMPASHFMSLCSSDTSQDSATRPTSAKSTT
jgi:hypothetical protein